MLLSLPLNEGRVGSFGDISAADDCCPLNFVYSFVMTAVALTAAAHALIDFYILAHFGMSLGQVRVSLEI